MSLDFNYYGRWQVDQIAIAINSGALVEFAYIGNACVLSFDVQGFTQYPAIFVQVDNGPIAKTTLSSSVNRITVTPLFNTLPSGQPPFATVSSRCHIVRFWIATHSLYQTHAAGKQWTLLDGGCKFLGVNLNDTDLIPLPYHSQQIEFLGDSITQGLRLLYTGTDNDTGHQMPYANWPQFVADLLGMKPVVTGFGGQGLTTAGTCGAPAASAAFAYIYNGAPWNPTTQPKVVVIYQGTNDGVSAEVFQQSYVTYLQIVRKAYPSAGLFAICPHNKTNYAVPIKSAVAQLNDPKIMFSDYSAGIISAHDTCDGCHLNPGGAVRLATTMAQDIQSALTRLALKP